MSPGTDFADEDGRGRLEDDVSRKEDEVGDVLDFVFVQLADDDFPRELMN